MLDVLVSTITCFIVYSAFSMPANVSIRWLYFVVSQTCIGKGYMVKITVIKTTQFRESFVSYDLEFTG